MPAKFELTKSPKVEFHFHLKAPNGQIIVTSQEYKSKRAAINGIESVKKNAPNDKLYERKVDKAGHPRFNLKAGNHQVIASSQGYHSEEAREKGISAVKKDAPSATVVDEAK